MSNSIILALPSPSGMKAPAPKDGCSCPFCGKTLPPGFKVDKSARQSSKCKKCNYTWVTMGEETKRCPKCGSYTWREPIVKATCLRCGYIWHPRGNKSPCRCPSCRSQNWNKIVVPKPPKKVDISRIIARTDINNARALIAGRNRCISGEAVYEVALELDIAVIDLIIAILGEGYGYRV